MDIFPTAGGTGAHRTGAEEYEAARSQGNSECTDAGAHAGEVWY